MDNQIAGIVTMLSLIIVVFVLFAIFRVLGCRISCWLRGVRIRTRSKQKTNKKLTAADRYRSPYYQNYGGNDNMGFITSSIPQNNDTMDTEKDEFTVTVENIERLCCLTVALTKDDEVDGEEQIIIPNSSKVTYGSFQKQTITTTPLNFNYCWKCCFNNITKALPRQPKNDTCPICLDAFTDKMALVLLECSHGYHDKCLTNWLKSKDTDYVECPICKNGMHIEGIAQETGELLKYQALPYMYGYQTTHSFRNSAVTFL